MFVVMFFFLLFLQAQFVNDNDNGITGDIFEIDNDNQM